jgi:choline dehydrogenase-like flavoprotein
MHRQNKGKIGEKKVKAIVVGTGAGGATAARKLAQNGFEVLMLEAGAPFSCLTHKISWLTSLRGSFLVKDEGSIRHFFPHYGVQRSGKDLALFYGITEGGCTSVSCGNMVRATNGLAEINLDLEDEYQEIESMIPINPIPRERWRPLSQRMFDEAEKLGYNPKPTPKGVDLQRCVGCGYCELGCNTGAKWDSRRLYEPLLGKSVTVKTDMPVQKVVVENGRATGVLAGRGRSLEHLNADIVVLSAGGFGTAQILRASDLPVKDKLWVDIVLTVGGISKGARMLNEPPMVWVVKKPNYILSPYFDILSFWLHKPWKDVSAENRVGMMIKLADVEQGSVAADGTVTKSLTDLDWQRLEKAKVEAQQLLERSGVEGPFVDGMVHGGHLGGTVPLTKDTAKTMRPGGLPRDLWVADLSLMPRSQGLPTIMTAAALALKVSKRIIGEKKA